MKTRFHSFFLLTLIGTISLRKACLHGCISWNLVQVKQQPLCSSSQSLISMRSGKAKTGLMFKSGELWILVVHLWQRNVRWAHSLRAVRMARSYLVTDLAVQQILGRRGPVGGGNPDVLQFTTSLTHHHLISCAGCYSSTIPGSMEYNSFQWVCA